MQEVQDSPGQSRQSVLSVKVSQFEVYNEQIYDLLAEETGAILGHRPALRLKEDTQGRIFVRDLSEVCLRCGNQVLVDSGNYSVPHKTCYLNAAGTDPSWQCRTNLYHSVGSCSLVTCIIVATPPALVW